MNPGNPLFSCDKKSLLVAAGVVPEPLTKEGWSKKQHPMYTTSSSSYGCVWLGLRDGCDCTPCHYTHTRHGSEWFGVLDLAEHAPKPHGKYLVPNY